MRETVSPIDDSNNVHLNIPSERPVQVSFEELRPTLHLRCAERTTDVFINVGHYLGTDSVQATIRLDDKEARQSSWSISSDFKAMFFRHAEADGSAIFEDSEFVKQLICAERMLVRVTPWGESPITVTFDLRGLHDAVIALREACAW